MTFLKKLFIKDYEKVEKQEVRLRYGIVAGIIGIISNVLLFVAKLVIGFIGNSITIIADAINNLSDAGSSAVTAIGFKLSSKPADSEHPYGHARYEYITALIVALIIFLIGGFLGKSSVEKIISNEVTTVNNYTYIILGIAIAVKVWQMLLYRNFGKAIDSDALMATSFDSRNDIISTSAVLVSSVIIQFVGQAKVSIDGIFGLAVSLFVIISAISLIRETIQPLLGTKPKPELVEEIKSKLLSYDGVLGLHDLMIHNYGGNNRFVLVHIEVSASEDILKSHDIIDNIEREFEEDLGMHLSVHMDPIETDNEEVNINKKKVQELIYKINPNLTIHDFRIVIGETHSNILFDVVIPFTEKTTKEEIEKVLNEAYENEDKNYFFIINIDKSYL
jgi:cation diffusion facilitator family transporter